MWPSRFTVRVDLRPVVDQEADRVEPAGCGDGDERSDAVPVSHVDLGALRHQVRNHFRLPEICGLRARFTSISTDLIIIVYYIIDVTLKRGVSPPMSTFSMSTLPVEMR